MSQPANDEFSQHLSDDEASNHEDASDTGAAPKQQQQVIPQTTAISNIKLPILKKEEYDIWAMEMEHYLEYIDNDVWKVIQNGNSKKRISTGKDGVIRILPPVTAAEIQAVEKERKAKNILLMAIPKEHMRRFHGMDDAKEIWEAIRTRFGGNANSKKMQKAIFKQQFEAFTISSSEGLEKGYDRFQQLLSQLEAHGAEVSTEDANHKFLRSLPPACAYNICTPTSSTNTPEKEALAGFADEIDDLDIEEMDINWQIAMIAITNKEVTTKKTEKESSLRKSTKEDSVGKPLYSRFIKTNDFKGVPHPLSGDYTPKPQEEIDESLYVYGKKGPQEPEPSVSDDRSSEYSTCQSNDSAGSIGTSSEHSFDPESEISRVPKEVYVSKPITTNEQGVSAPKSKEVEPSCVSHIKTPRQPIKDQETPKVNRKNWNAMKERELGEGYSFTKKKCFVCGSLSHLIKDCDYYEKKMAREAEFKKQRVFNTGNRVAKPVWINDDRINHANQFVPRSVQLNTDRPNINSVRPNINTGRTNINSVRPRVNTVNTVRSRQPVPTRTSNSFSPKRPQVNQFNQRRHFSKSHSSVRRPFAKNTAQMSHSHAVKGNWGSAVKTSAGYNWRNTIPNSNCNGGPTFIRTDHPLKNMIDRGIFDSGCSGHMTGNKDQLEDFEEFNGGSVTFGGSKGYISGKGKIRVGNLDFDSVSFVKELGHFNLFSISQICDKQHKVLFTETECLVVSSDFKMPDENQILLKVPRHHNMYSFDMKTPTPAKGFACLIAKATSDESKLWHRRLGHINFKNLNKLVKGNLVRGLPSKVFKNDHTCVACHKGKQHRASCKAKLERLITEPLHTLHMDLFGPRKCRVCRDSGFSKRFQPQGQEALSITQPQPSSRVVPPTPPITQPIPSEATTILPLSQPAPLIPIAETTTASPSPTPSPCPT
ncbi:ribonuclease H-like domain-containing protein [Tanacetum coccineum]